MQIHDLPAHWALQFHQDVHITQGGIVAPRTRAKDAEATDLVGRVQRPQAVLQYGLDLVKGLHCPIAQTWPMGSGIAHHEL